MIDTEKQIYALSILRGASNEFLRYFLPEFLSELEIRLIVVAVVGMYGMFRLLFVRFLHDFQPYSLCAPEPSKEN